MAFLTSASVFLLSFLPRKGIDVREKKKKDRWLVADNELKTYIDRRRCAVVEILASVQGHHSTREGCQG